MVVQFTCLRFTNAYRYRISTADLLFNHNDIQRDTLFVSNYQFDSVYVFKDKITDRSRDTLYIREVQTEYKYRILRDTILKVQHDSIPYEVTKIITKEIQRPLTFFDRLCRICFFFLLGSLVTFLFIKIKRVFKY